MINKNIIFRGVKTYHGSNIECIEFELNNLKYFAVNEWNDEGNSIRCEYSRDLPVEYYDTIATLQGATEGMNILQPICKFNNMPIELFEEIKKSARRELIKI